MRSRRTSGAEASGLTAAIETVKWETRRLGDILERVIPHFEAFPLLSVRLRNGSHLSAD
jgi:hypothetical protein